MILVAFDTGFVSPLECKISEANCCCTYGPSQDFGVVLGERTAAADSAEDRGPDSTVGEANDDRAGVCRLPIVAHGKDLHRLRAHDVPNPVEVVA